MAHVFGERTLATLERLLSLLSAFEVVVWMTDGWPLFFEYCLTTIWAFTCLVGFIIYAVQLAGVPLNIELTHIAATHTAGILLCTLCLLQFIVSLMIENRYEHNLTSSLFWIIWFPVIFWMLSLATTLVSFTRVMLMPKKQRARWVSPDRGILRG